MKYAALLSAVFIISALCSAAACYTIGMRRDPELAKSAKVQLQNNWDRLKCKIPGIFSTEKTCN